MNMYMTKDSAILLNSYSKVTVIIFQPFCILVLNILQEASSQD